MNKQEELKKPIVVLNDVYGKDPRNTDVCYPLSTILKAMEEYADQFKKQLKEKEDVLEEYTNALWKAEEQLTKSNEMAVDFAEWIKNNYTSEYYPSKGWVWERVDTILPPSKTTKELLTEYQNSKK